jgi:hypothetical protein
MSIYDVLVTEIPIIAYSVLHQSKKSVPTKEYAKVLSDLRGDLKSETTKIQTAWQTHLTDLTATTVQTTRGNLSQFLSTPLQSDTGEIQRIIKDQINQTSGQLLPKIHYGLLAGYDGRYLIDAKQSELPKSRVSDGKSFLQNSGFKMGKTSSAVFESLYIVQGGSNLDLLEYMIRKGIGVYNSAHGNKIDRSGEITSALQNLLFLDGSLEQESDRFEFQVKFAKGNIPYDTFHKNLDETIRTFRTEIHHLNVSLWQRKLGLGPGEEYNLRIRTKDRMTLRSLVNIIERFAKEKNNFANALGAGVWLVKEII